MWGVYKVKKKGGVMSIGFAYFLVGWLAAVSIGVLFFGNVVWDHIESLETRTHSLEMFRENRKESIMKEIEKYMKNRDIRESGESEWKVDKYV